ncbi:MAG TPA: transcription termination/antitermination protein NusA, partial [Actinomycetota bacterium]
VRNVVTELRGEKIDVVPWSADPATFVANALQPAKVREARVDPETQTALVIVPDYQLSLAIGREGQNARLAARLTGWRIDIKSETQFADEQRGGPRPVVGAVAAGAAKPSPTSAPSAAEAGPAEGEPAGTISEGGSGSPDDRADASAADDEPAATTGDGAGETEVVDVAEPAEEKAEA